MIDGLFDGSTGKTLLVSIGVLGGALLAWLVRVGYRKIRDLRDRYGL